MAIELIAEVSTNHGGELSLAKEFIHAYAEAGATWVKFQHTRVKHLRPSDPQQAWFRQAEFSLDQFADLKAYCEKRGTGFLTTVYNVADVPEVLSLGVDTVKIGSGEEDVHAELIDAFSSVRIIQSIHFVGRPRVPEAYGKVDILSCVTRYPASERACLSAIASMESWGLAGYSDHSIGNEMCRWAIECGARIVEKHVMLNHQARTPKPYEATVDEFRGLCQFAADGPEKFMGRWQHA